MRFHAATVATAAAVVIGFTMMQSCPAPIVNIAPIIADLIIQFLDVVIDATDNKRDVVDGGNAFAMSGVVSVSEDVHARGKYCMPVPNDVPENVIENCCGSLGGAHTTVTGHNPRSGKRFYPYSIEGC